MNHRECEFTLLLDGPDERFEEITVALYNAFSDATLSSHGGRMYLEFSREAPTLVEAILSAIGDVEKSGAGVSVLRVDHCDLVTQSEIARRADIRKRQTVNNYVTGIRGPGGFPAPACNITDGAPLWYWCEVAEWLYEHGYVDESVLRDAAGLATINAALDLKHQRHVSPELVDLVNRTLCSS